MIITHLKIALYAIYVIIVIGTILTIVYDKREPSKALIWISVVSLIPILGILFYVLLGRNHRREKIFNRKGIKDLQQIGYHYWQTEGKYSCKNRPFRHIRYLILFHLDSYSLSYLTYTNVKFHSSIIDYSTDMARGQYVCINFLCISKRKLRVFRNFDNLLTFTLLFYIILS